MSGEESVVSDSLATAALGRPRSPLFRALGESDPPSQILLQSGVHVRTAILKHDSWAATATYFGPCGKIICKFNRVQPILGFPQHGMGRMLAQREATFLHRLRDVPGVPRWLGPVYADGRLLHHALARSFIEGHPLARAEKPGGRFFETLAAILRAMHERGMAYVDLHKPENILVGDDGNPYLIDFQISFSVPTRPGIVAAGATSILELLQHADWYHWERHRHRSADIGRYPKRDFPWFIKAHRFVAKPLRTARRKLLVALRIRTGEGRVESEHFAEEAVRLSSADQRRAA